MMSVSSGGESPAEVERLRRFVRWVSEHELVDGVYADDDHPYSEWITPEGDEMDFSDVHARAREALDLAEIAASSKRQREARKRAKTAPRRFYGDV